MKFNLKVFHEIHVILLSQEYHMKPNLKILHEKISCLFFSRRREKVHMKSTWYCYHKNFKSHLCENSFWTYTHPTPFHFANYFLATWTRCCMEQWCAPPQSDTNGIEVKVDSFCAQEKVECFESFSSSRKHYRTMQRPFSPICWGTFQCSPLILWIGKSIFWECHGTFPISSVVSLKSKVAITHYCENLQNLIDY
jgi:hypothetical protein